MDNPNPIYYKDLVTPDSAITDLIKQLSDLIVKYDELKGKLQSSASQMETSMKGLSSATEEQRQAMKTVVEQSEKLIIEYRDVTTKQWAAKQAFEEANAAKRESAQVDKLITQIQTSAEGSYNRLSAQYRLNKIRLNELSAAERATVPEFRQLEQETKNIYEEMKRLQEATGKHQLNVGNYADAAKGLKMELRSLVEQMAYMKLEGKQNSDEYMIMAKRAGELKDAMVDAQNETKILASDTSKLDTIMSGASTVAGGFSAITGLMGLFGRNSGTAAKMQQKLQSAMAIVIGLTKVQNELQKESALMTGIRTIQTRALAKAQAMQTAATGKATIAQKIFNAVANANPYVLLATAILTVVGALAALSAGNKDAEESEARMNEELDEAKQKYLELLNVRLEYVNVHLRLAKAQGKSLQEQNKLEDEAYRREKNILEERRGNLSKELQAYDVLMTKYVDDTYYNVQEQWNRILEIFGSYDFDINDIIKKVEELLNAELELEAKRTEQLNNRRKQEFEYEKKMKDIVRDAQQARIELIEDGFSREIKLAKLNYDKNVDNLRNRLDTEKGLTESAREALNNQIALLEEKLQRDVDKIKRKYEKIDIDAERKLQDDLINLIDDKNVREQQKLDVAYQRKREDLEWQLKNDASLSTRQKEALSKQLLALDEKYNKDSADLYQKGQIDKLNSELATIDMRLESVAEGSDEELNLRLAKLNKQRDIELRENSLKEESVRQKEDDINNKWNKKILNEMYDFEQKRADAMLEISQQLAESEFNLLDKNERQKTQFRLQQEKERLQAILRLNKQNGKELTDEQKKTIQNTIDAIDKESKKSPFKNLYEVLGIGVDSDQQDALNSAISGAIDGVNAILDALVQESEAAVNAANARVDAAQTALDAEIEARNNGYANNVLQAQKELELEKAQQQKALEEKEKAQKAQLALDTITQASSLITASANIWASLSPIPYVGPALAISTLATMWGSFALSKIKALQLTQLTESYGDGTVELLQGGSHASGHDIDMGTTRDGKRRRAEGGEYFAIINKRNSRRYGHIIPDVINAFNDGTFADKYQRANANMAGMAVAMVGGTGTDVSALEKDVREIREQGARSRFVDGNGNVVEVYKNLRQTILKS